MFRRRDHRELHLEQPDVLKRTRAGFQHLQREGGNQRVDFSLLQCADQGRDPFFHELHPYWRCVVHQLFDHAA
ncbi:hypothetical protein D3C71_1966030 [compost metagenome]